MNIGPYWIKFRAPCVAGKRPGKNWVCVNKECDEAYGPLRRLSKSGCCRRCGKGLRKVRSV